jgi:hypothetical protein
VNTSGIWDVDSALLSPYDNVPVLADRDAFLEHERCGDLDGGLDGDHVWMTCSCGAVISRCADDD